MLNSQMWYISPILLCIGVLSFYVFFIWYRDWFGRHTFIYRILMLPTARRNIYFSKLTAILLFVFSLISFQLLMLPIHQWLVKLNIPAELRENSPLVDGIIINQALVELIPRQFEQFLYLYGLGAVIVMVLFTVILLERSFHLWGILYGLLYISGCVLIIISPILYFGDRSIIYLYPNEVYVLALLLFALVSCLSVWLGTRLLTKKITV